MRTSAPLLVLPLSVAFALGCGPNVRHVLGEAPGGGAGAGGDGGGADAGAHGVFGDAAPTHDAGTMLMGDPTTCDEAKQYKTYLGCDYWPTALTNPVWSIFDFAVAVANTGAAPAMVTVTGPNGASQTATVAPNGLTKIYLPWVQPLKGGDADECGNIPAPPSTMMAPGAAYHLTSTLPVTVYQFDALEYQGKGGPPGKSWASCTGATTPCNGQLIGCFSFSNDASLLIPTPALTRNYRFGGPPGTDLTFQVLGMTIAQVTMADFLAITATADGTNVAVTLSKTSHTLAGGGVPAGNPGDVLQFKMNAGDVAEIFSDINQKSDDLGGSLVQADKPIQVIGGVQCANYPGSASACDHVEQTTLPAETLGKHYVVTVPTAPGGAPVGHIVHFVGNQDGTHLTYAPQKPPNCPDTLDAGEVAECVDLTTAMPNRVVTQDFEVKGDKEFGVMSLMLGASLQDPGAQAPNQEGDPSSSIMVAVEQWRTKYVFLAPDDYERSFADIAAPAGAMITLDGAPPGAAPTPIGGGYEVYRVPLGGGQGGAHLLESDQPVGIQVLGFGAYTSYQYPGGLNLDVIAPPPPPPPPPK